MIPSEHLKDAMSAINDHVRDLEEQLAASQARTENLDADRRMINSALVERDAQLAASEAECERLRAALADIRTWTVAGFQDQSTLVDHIDAALAGASAPHDPFVDACLRRDTNEVMRLAYEAATQLSAPPVRDERVPPPGWYPYKSDGQWAGWARGALRVGTLRSAWTQYDAEHGYAPRTQEPAPTCMYCDGKGRCSNGGLCVPCEGSGAETVLHAVLCEVSRVAESIDDGMDVTCELRGIIQRAIEGRALTQEPAPAASPSESTAIADEVLRMVHAFGDQGRRREVRLLADRIRALAGAVPSEPTRAQVDTGPDSYTGACPCDRYRLDLITKCWEPCKPAAEPTEAERPQEKDMKKPTEVVASGPGWSQTRDHRMAEHHAAMKAERPRQQGWDVDDIVSAPAREPQQSEPAVLPDVEGWKWNAKLGGYVLDLDEENNEWRRVYIGRRSHIVIEQQADDDNALIGCPAAVLRALLRESADTRIARAMDVLRNDRGYALFSVVREAIAILTGAPQGEP
jgi:hypothetical protein